MAVANNERAVTIVLTSSCSWRHLIEFLPHNYAIPKSLSSLFFVDGTSFSYSSCDILQIITMIDHVLKRDGGMINEIMYVFLTRIKQKWSYFRIQKILRFSTISLIYILHNKCCKYVLQSLSAPFTFIQPFLDFGYYPTQVTHGTPAVHPWFSMGCVSHLSFLCDWSLFYNSGHAVDM
jgi:hypothetical protein